MGAVRHPMIYVLVIQFQQQEREMTHEDIWNAIERLPANTKCLVRDWPSAVVWIRRRLIAANAGPKKASPVGRPCTVCPKFWRPPVPAWTILPSLFQPHCPTRDMKNKNPANAGFFIRNNNNHWYMYRGCLHPQIPSNRTCHCCLWR